jgi:hypothetical protein
MVSIAVRAPKMLPPGPEIRYESDSWNTSSLPFHAMKTSSPFVCGFSSEFLIAVLLLLGGLASAQDKTNLKDHPYFKQTVGEWSSEGERKYTDGRVVKITQEWKTEVLSPNSLSIEGDQTRDGQSTHYKWTITLMDSGLIEAIYQRDASKPDTQRYEVQAADDGSHVELTALLDNNSKVVTTDTFKKGNPDTIESTTTRTDPNGATIYTATATAKKKP